MSTSAKDHRVPAALDSPSPRPVQSQMLQYFSPENPAGSSEISGGVSVSVQEAPVSLDLSQNGPQVKTDVPDKPRKGILKHQSSSGPAARRKLSYPPKRNRSMRMKVNFKNALFKVLRKIDPAGTISSKAMDVLNDLMCDVMERLASEAATIRAKDGKATLRSREIQTAVRLVLPGSLFTHAFYEAHRALRSYVESKEPASA